jgi:hypothetical protein
MDSSSDEVLARAIERHLRGKLALESACYPAKIEPVPSRQTTRPPNIRLLSARLPKGS